MIKLCTIVMVLFACSAGYAQVHQGLANASANGDPDSLELHHEWWIGGIPSVVFGTNFGALTLNYVSSEAPGETPLVATTSGGFSVGTGLAAGLEYKPYNSKLSYYAQPGVELRWTSAYNSQATQDGIYAYNAKYEAQNTVFYATLAVGVQYQIDPSGIFILGGLSLDVPIQTLDSYLWQHENSTGGTVNGAPGAPQTSIKFATQPTFSTRVGGQIGIGKDLLVGLFGYQGQIITPFVLFQGGTPTVSGPTSWNSLILRIGVMWRTGM